MLVTSKISIDLQNPGTNKVIYAMQNDENTRAVEISLFYNGVPWEIPSGTTCAVSFKKPDGSSGLYDTLPNGDEAYSISENKITATMASQMLTVAGNVPTAVIMYDELYQLGTFPFIVSVEPNPSANGGISNDYYNFQNFAEVNKAIGNLNDLATVNKTNLVSAINESITLASKNKNLLNGANVKLIKGAYHSSANGIQTNEHYDYFSNVPLIAGVEYTFSPKVRFIYNHETGEDIVNSATENFVYTPQLSDGKILVDVSVYATDTQNMKVYNSAKYDTEDVEAYGEDPDSEKEIPTKTSQLENDSGFITEEDLPIKFKNLFNGKNVIFNEGQYNNAGTITYNDAYNCFSGVKLVKGNTYTISPRVRFIYNVSTKENVYAGKDIHSFTADEDMVVDISVYAKDMESVKLYDSGNYALADVESYGESPFDENTVFLGNVLYGKKWVACGDSFTAGTTDDVFQDGKFKGKNKVYPYFIGLRNNMEIVNEAVSGSTMTNVDTDSFSETRYTEISEDADYITLWFGINDEHQSCEIGTIDDEANTTFYGAWNIVMEHLIENHPFAKIGIIITNGSAPEYTNAERAIAKKWGIPYLDLQADYGVPLMHRVTERSEVCEKAIDLRKQAFWVSVEEGAEDGHPNPKAHEYQSTFIEHWLRSL